MHWIGPQLNHSRSAAGWPCALLAPLDRADALNGRHTQGNRRAQPAPTKFGIHVCRTRRHRVSRQPCSLIATRGGTPRERHSRAIRWSGGKLLRQPLRFPLPTMDWASPAPCLPSQLPLRACMQGDDDGCAAPRSSTLFSPRRFLSRFFQGSSFPIAQAHPSRHKKDTGQRRGK